MPHPDLRPVVLGVNRPQRPAGNATRRRLLDGGRRIFAREGFAGAGTQEIVAGCRAVAPDGALPPFRQQVGIVFAVGSEVYDISHRPPECRDRILGILQWPVGRADSGIRRVIGRSTLAPMTVTVQLEVARNERIRAAMADTLASFWEFVTDIARTAPADLVEIVGVRAVALAIVGLLQGMGSLGATLHDPNDLVATTVVLRRLLLPNSADDR